MKRTSANSDLQGPGALAARMAAQVEASAPRRVGQPSRRPKCESQDELWKRVTASWGDFGRIPDKLPKIRKKSIDNSVDK